MIDGTTDIVASREEDGRKNEIWWKVEIEQVIIAYDALTVLLIQQTVFLN
jgi:hypothetical protein